MSRMIPVVALFLTALVAVGCGGDAEEQVRDRDLETDEVDFDDRADQAEVRIRADGMSVWLRPEVEPVFRESLGQDVWFFRGRTSHNLGHVAATVDGTNVASAGTVSARVFEIYLTFRQMADVIAGEPLLVELANERGEEWHLAIDLRPRLEARDGSWRIYPWVNVVPVVDDRAVWLRGRVTTNTAMADLFAYNDDDSAPERITAQDDRRWKLDWHPLAMPWAGAPPEYPVYIVAEDFGGTHHTLEVGVLMRMRRAALSSAGPAAVLPDGACDPAVAACLQSLDTLDTEECGEARDVIACGALEMEGPAFPAVTEVLVGAQEIEAGGFTWVEVSFGAPVPAGSVLTTTATGSMAPVDPIELDEGVNHVQFNVHATDEPGPGSLTFTLGGASQTREFEIFDDSCLIISMYIEGSSTNNKAVQLYNCSDRTLQLSDYYVCLYANDATSCSNTVRLEPETLSPGGIFNLCRTTAESGTNPYPEISNNCSQIASSVMNFNGDDRLLIFRDRDGSGSFTSGDQIMDAFGELTVRPASLIWGNRTYRRCDFTPFDGQTSFDVLDYYREYPQDTVDGFGMPPQTDLSCE